MSIEEGLREGGEGRERERGVSSLNNEKAWTRRASRKEDRLDELVCEDVLDDDVSGLNVYTRTARDRSERREGREEMTRTQAMDEPPGESWLLRRRNQVSVAICILIDVPTTYLIKK